MPKGDTGRERERKAGRAEEERTGRGQGWLGSGVVARFLFRSLSLALSQPALDAVTRLVLLLFTGPLSIGPDVADGFPDVA